MTVLSKPPDRDSVSQYDASTDSGLFNEFSISYGRGLRYGHTDDEWQIPYTHYLAPKYWIIGIFFSPKGYRFKLVFSELRRFLITGTTAENYKLN